MRCSRKATSNFLLLRCFHQRAGLVEQRSRVCSAILSPSHRPSDRRVVHGAILDVLSLCRANFALS